MLAMAKDVGIVKRVNGLKSPPPKANYTRCEHKENIRRLEMIQLNIKEYCHECPMFEPKMTTYQHATGSLKVITCDNTRMCSNLKNYLESVKEDNNVGYNDKKETKEE